MATPMGLGLDHEISGKPQMPHQQDPETRMHGQKSPKKGAVDFQTGNRPIAYADGWQPKRPPKLVDPTASMWPAMEET